MMVRSVAVRAVDAETLDAYLRVATGGQPTDG